MDYPVIVSDTAGIRSSRNEIEKKGIKIALKRAEDADLKVSHNIFKKR